MSDILPYFFALEPDSGSQSQVLGWKRTVFELAGPQLYLNDPPHLTLYLALYSRQCSLADIAKRLAGELQLPPLELEGWHVFEADVLTDRNTLVCNLTPASCDALRRVQQSVVAAVAGLRDATGTYARYEASWQRLSQIERSNVESVGFPFVGSIWHPHVSIASIERKAWAKVHGGLGGIRPSGPLQMPWLALYCLEQEYPILVGRWAIGCQNEQDYGR